MRQIERYVMIELLRVFGVLVTISTLMFVFVGVFTEAQKLDLGFSQILQIMPYFVPSLMPYTIPATSLLTVCVVYGRMAGDCEIIAVRAAGIHIMHLMWPALCLGGSLSLIVYVLSDQVTPWAFQQIENIVALAMEDIFLDKLRSENQINDKDNGFTIVVTDVKGRTLIQPTIRYLPRDGMPTTITAKEAYVEFDMKKQQVGLTLVGIRGNFDGPHRTGYMNYKKIDYALPKATGSAGLRGQRSQDLRKDLDTHFKQLTELYQRQAVETAFALAQGDLATFRCEGFERHKMWMGVVVNKMRILRSEYHSRIAMSVSTFFVVLLGTPFSILMAKKQFLTSFLFCFLPILLVYYPVTMLTQNMSKSGKIDPLWASWIANAILFMAASYNIRRVIQN